MEGIGCQQMGTFVPANYADFWQPFRLSDQSEIIRDGSQIS